MNLTLHLVRDDVLRLRPWIAVWVAVLALPPAIGGYFLAHNPFASGDGDPRQLLQLLPATYGVIGLLGYVLTILLIQGHVLIGTRQFWLTRPISRARLLQAKTIGAFLIVGLIPVLVSLPWWLWCGFGLPQIAAAALDVLIVQTVIVVAGAFIAVLTDSFSRALLWSLVFVAMLLFTGFIISFVSSLTAVQRDMGLTVSRNVAAVAGCVLLLAAAVVVQFLVRRRGWWLGAVGVALVGWLLAAQSISWSWLAPKPREFRAETAAAVTVHFSRAVAQPPPERTPQNRGKELSQYVNVFLTAGGIPTGWAVSPLEIEQSWNWERSFALHPWAGLSWGSDPFAALGLKAAQHYDVGTRRWLPGPARATDEPSVATVRAVSAFGPSLVARMRTDPPHYAARSWWMLARPEITLEGPLAPRPRQQDGGHGLRIDQVTRKSSGVTAQVVETHPFLLRRVLNEMAGARIWQTQFAPRWGEWPLVALNRKRMEYTTWRDEDNRKTRTILINGVTLSWRSIALGGPAFITEPNSPLAHWLEDASFGVLAFRDQAVFHRDVEVERFEFAN